MIQRHQVLLGLVAALTGATAWTPVGVWSRRDLARSLIVAAPLVCMKSPAVAKNLPESTGATTGKEGTVEALVGVVELQNSLRQLRLDGKVDLSQLPTDEKKFKAIFDAYSDTVSYKQKFVDQNAFLVYYTQGFDGPGRPSIESDLPTRQPQQYGARNEAWVAWQEFLDELDYVRKHPDDSDDLAALLTRTVEAVDRYLALVPEQEVEAARARISSR